MVELPWRKRHFVERPDFTARTKGIVTTTRVNRRYVENYFASFGILLVARRVSEGRDARKTQC
jgi:hypothetical protein